MSADPVSFGEVLRRLRSSAALSQEALAERAGLSKRGISDLERGARQAPRLETVRLLADALALGEHERADLLAAARPAAPRRSLSEPASPIPVSLPVPLTRLIGREMELATLQAKLQHADVRLLTLTGPGGVGKTRLAVAVASGLHETFPDGVVFVDLSPLTDPDLVMPAVAMALDVREVAGRLLVETLTNVLAPKRLLLVLDNCERVLATAPVLTTLLAASPGLTILATSREPFHMRGEHEFQLLPLPLPAADGLPTVEELMQVPAAALFIERALATKQDFTLTATNAATVAAICTRLDGLPLAIELAAARIKVLPPASLLARIEHRLPLLTGGGPDLPVRQRTLRDAIAWSYDLLEPAEQVLFRRLAVFAGGCTLEAAEAVVNQEGTRDVFAGIATLVDTSLLRQEGVEGEPRFRMLETIREFGLERLEASGEGAASRSRHALYFLGLAERTNAVIMKTSGPALLDVIEREHDNLRAALGWSRETSDHDTFLRLAGALALFWYYRGHLNEGRRWLGQALLTPANDDAPWPRAWALTASGMLANVGGESERATDLLMASFSWWERSGDALRRAFAGNQLGGSYVGQGRYDEAAPLFAATEAYARDAGHDDLLANALFHLGAIAWAQGDDARAHILLHEAVERYDRYGTPTDAIDPLRYLGLLACAAGDHQEAAGWFAEELTRLRQRGSRAALAVGLADVATLATAREAWQPAVRLFAKAEALLQAEAAAFSLPARDHYERSHHRAREALGAAASEVCAAGRALTLEQALTEAEAVMQEPRQRY